jgi:hypothetical protein
MSGDNWEAIDLYYLCVVREELFVSRHVAHLTRGALRTHATRARAGVGRGAGRSAAAAAAAVAVTAGGAAMRGGKTCMEEQCDVRCTARIPGGICDAR